MRKILLIAAASLISALCWGQEFDLSPRPEVQKLDWLIGNWESSGVWSMEGMEMNVETTVKVEWDGQFLRHTTVSDFVGMMTMTETMMFGYDPAKEWYFSSAYTNMSPTPRIEFGRLVGNTLVMVSEPWQIEGDASVSRVTLVKVSNDEYIFTLEFQEGEKWNVINKSVFKRKK